MEVQLHSTVGSCGAGWDAPLFSSLRLCRGIKARPAGPQGWRTPPPRPVAATGHPGLTTRVPHPGGMCVSVSTGNHAVAWQPCGPRPSAPEPRSPGSWSRDCWGGVRRVGPASRCSLFLPTRLGCRWQRHQESLGLLQTCRPRPGAAPGAGTPGRPALCQHQGGPGTALAGTLAKPCLSWELDCKASRLLSGLGEEQGGRRCARGRGGGESQQSRCSACVWGRGWHEACRK